MGAHPRMWHAATTPPTHLNFWWPAAPPFLSARPALPPPTFWVAALALALSSALVCFAGLALPIDGRLGKVGDTFCSAREGDGT